MPNNKKKGRSAKKAAKDDRKVEKERKKIEARLIHEPCPNGLRCADTKCRYAHVCPDALEYLTRVGFSMACTSHLLEDKSRKITDKLFPDGLDASTPVEGMSTEAQERLATARRAGIRKMIKESGHDFRFCFCSRRECGDILQLNGVAKGNANLREEIDALYCAKCDCTFCQDCMSTCKGCRDQLCYGCEPLLEYVSNVAKFSGTIAGEIFSARDGHCSSCSGTARAKKIQALDGTKYRTAMRELYSDFTACAYCAMYLPNGPETKRCGGCSAVRYCNKECQEKDWSGKHREYCQVLRQDRNDRLAKWYQKHQPKLEAEAGLWDIE